MTDESEGILKEAFTAFVTRHLPGGTEEIHRKPVRISGLSEEILT
jgi:hypothetical protein